MIRQAKLNDLDQIWDLRLQTSKLLKTRHIDQWQYHKPEKQTFIDDINHQEFFVYVIEQKIVGMIAIKSGIEKTYLNIYDGTWRCDMPYWTIHRLAVNQDYLGKNISIQLLDFAHNLALKNQIRYMRIDTHEDNKNAQKVFENVGYKLVGYILLEENHPGERKRLAYDLILNEEANHESFSR